MNSVTGTFTLSEVKPDRFLLDLETEADLPDKLTIPIISMAPQLDKRVKRNAVRGVLLFNQMPHYPKGCFELVGVVGSLDRLPHPDAVVPLGRSGREVSAPVIVRGHCCCCRCPDSQGRA